MKYFFFLTLAMIGCANVSTTRFEYQDALGGRVVVEMPKEIVAKDLKVSIDAKNASATIQAASWTSRNVETIAAQGERESGVSGAIAEGAAKGIVKGIKGF